MILVEREAPPLQDHDIVDARGRVCPPHVRAHTGLRARRRRPATPRDLPTHPDFAQYPAPPWPKIHALLKWVYGFCEPTALRYDNAHEPLRGFRRWIFEPHAARSSARYTELGHLLACGSEWMELVETPQERLAHPSWFLTNRPTSELRPLRNVVGECCDPATMTVNGPLYRCPICGFEMHAITGGVGGVYYISPTGNDSNTGTTSGSPWKTWSRSLSAMTPGDILNVMDGTYTQATSGLMRPPSGNSSNVLTVQAVNERIPTLTCDGTDDTVQLFNKSYVALIGLAIENSDHDWHGGGGADWLGGVVNCASGSHHLTIQRCLARHPNRYSNVGCFGLYDTTASLVHECEVYEHNRIAYGGNPTIGNTYRRCYANEKGYAQLTTGKGFTSGVHLYSGSNNIVENAMVETLRDQGDGSRAYNQQGQYNTNDDNRWLGCIARDVDQAIIQIQGNEAAGSTPVHYPRNTILEHVLTIDTTSGWAFRGALNSQPRNVTSTTSIGADPQSGSFGAGNASSWFGTNISVIGGNLNINQPGGASATKCNVYNGSVSGVSGVTNINPQQATIRPWVPDAPNPMNGAGLGGTWPSGASAAHIGATILYAYQNGTITTQPLWDIATGAFIGRGAVKTGWNDSLSTALAGYHARVNVDPLFFPSGYQGGVAQLNITGRSPGSGATGVHPATSITIKADQPFDPVTVLAANVFLQQGGSGVACALLGPEAGTGIVTLRPTAPLATSTVYTVTIKGGTNGLKGLGDFQFSTDQTWTFTTAPSTAALDTALYADTDTPSSTGTPGTEVFQVGTAFRVDQVSTMVGVKGYKPGGPDGRVALLWRASDGAKLAETSFSGETAAGWQFQAFSAPVTLAQDTTYVAAIQVPSNGQWSYTVGGLTTSLEKAGIEGLGTGLYGNGRYRYAQTPNAMPDQSASGWAYYVNPILSGGAPVITGAAIMFAPSRRGGHDG